MKLTDYEFVSHWDLEAPYDQVFDVLADIGSYGRWWKEVRDVIPVDEYSVRAQIRSRLPYTLHYTLTRGEEDRRAGRLVAQIAGDIEGEARWTLTKRGDVTHVRYEQHVTTRVRAMRWLAPVARPAFRLNHRSMMRSGRSGLVRYLRTPPVSWRRHDDGRDQ